MNKIENGRSKRQRERLNLSLSIRVLCRETSDESWEEVARSTDVTPFGAGFMLSRPIEVGRLLLLTLAMPRQLRCYDHLETNYQVWCLVRHVRVIKGDLTHHTKYSIGVAFVGKYPPPSYHHQPKTFYEVIEPNEIGFWRLREAHSISLSSGNELTNVQKKSSIAKRQSRHSIPLNVMIEVFNDSGETIASELTVTENISATGASVLTTLEIDNGSFVRISSEFHGISTVAVVREIKNDADGNTRLRLEFIDRQFPIEEIQEN